CIYTFKNGGLLGVSPVKKPRITTIKEDQSLTMWANHTATEEEKTAVGICGVDAQNKTNVNTKHHRQASNNTQKHTKSAGGQSSIFHENKTGFHSCNTPAGQLLLLPKF